MNNPTEFYKESLLNIVKRYDIDFDIFKNKKKNMFISGSVAIQAIIGEVWTDSDLDIFAYEDDLARLITYLHGKNYVLEYVSSITYIDNLQVFKFKKPETMLKIDIVIINKNENTYKFFERFDLDVCQTRFDGENFIIQGNINGKVIHYKNGAKFSVVINRTEVRIEKYKTRGFSIIYGNEKIEK